MKTRHTSDWWTFQRDTATDGYSELLNYGRNRKDKLIRLGNRDPDTGEYADDRALKLVRLVRSDEARSVTGLMLKGEAGVVQEVHDFDDADPEAAPVYKIERSQGALTPLFFQLHVRDGLNFAIAILQTFGNDGMKGYLEDDLNKFFAQQAERKTVRLTQFVDANVLQSFAQSGQMQDIVLVNSGKTPTSRRQMEAATVDSAPLDEEGDKLEVKVHRRGGWPSRVLQNLLRRIQRQEKVTDIVKLPGLTEVDDLLVDIERGHQTQRFSLLNPDDSPLRYDYTAQLIPQADGLPSWASLQLAADEVWLDVQQLL
ncbi:MAG TPA: hypothetical protein VF595_00520 [Tepidisphaeraceae bacterium]|jgi:hypothetical protein